MYTGDMALQFVGLIIALTMIDGTFGEVQSIRVFGRLYCGRKPKPWPNMTITLWDRDYFSPHDLLDTTTSGKDGFFMVYGEEDEFLAIEPFIEITHNCDLGYPNNTHPRCWHTDHYDIPPEYVDGALDIKSVHLHMEGIPRKTKCN
ncbi:unnamed protein product [Anisakis simplex]|uniref:Transthyretin-like family protein n=1 Tax=Anisakis simplex TaxID=6269 RepID=A0A158PPE1_ANISI|nr:unnamed protein product [Anisakis simplex]